MDLLLEVFRIHAAGKAMGRSDHPVFHEILTHGLNCWLVPHADLNAWTQAIEPLRGNHALLNSLGACARRHFFARHTWKRRAAAVLAGYAR